DFQKNPADPRYRSAGKQARAIRERADRDDTEYQQRQQDFSRRLRPTGDDTGPAIWTGALLAACFLVAIATQLGQDHASPVLRALWIVPVSEDGERWDSKSGLRATFEQGQPWRLVTPIFIHLGPIHLLFNMLMLYSLGSTLEPRLGSWAFLGLV